MGDHQHTTIKHSDHVLLDQPLLRLPYELLRNNFRSAHFYAEKDSAGIKTQLKDATTNGLNGRSSPADLARSLDTMIAQAKGLRGKLSGCADEETRLLRQEEARISHVDELYRMTSFDDVKYEAWSRTRLDRLLIDYMLRKGCSKSAGALAAEQGMEDLVDVETLVSMNRIQESLRRGSVQEALAWCNQNKKELRKLESGLEFKLRFQQFIEMIRNGSDPTTCLTHIKKFLIPHHSSFPNEVRAACGMLAFIPYDPDTVLAHGYAELFSRTKWDDLAERFTSAHNELLGLPSAPLLHVALSSGLSALKTPTCHAAAREGAVGGYVTSANNTASGHSSLCPICSPELKELAMNVPYAQHTKSILEHDLVVLPNGRVYGRQKLMEHARKLGLPPEQVRDPHTKAVYPMDATKKVFIT